MTLQRIEQRITQTSVGDISAVTTTAPLQGGGTSGDLALWDASEKSMVFTDSTISLNGAPSSSLTDANIVLAGQIFGS